MGHSDERTVECPLCAGRGGFMARQERLCEVCSGTGRNMSGRMTLWNRSSQAGAARPPNACPACNGARRFVTAGYEACATRVSVGRLALYPDVPPSRVTYGDTAPDAGL